MYRLTPCLFALVAACARAEPPAPAPLAILYPQDGSIFPPEFPPPTFVFRSDRAPASTMWRVRIAFGDGGAALHAVARGAHPRIGPIDPECVADTNRPPVLPPEEAAARTWTPDRATWDEIQRRSVRTPATVTIAGYAVSGRAVLRGRVTIRTARERVGAPIFYRDVPLMPSEVEKGVIKPLAAAAIPLVAWRLRNVSETSSRVVMEGLPVCANCHSFSADGKTLGMDLDGLEGNRGMYIFTSLRPRTEVHAQDVVQWRTREGTLAGKVRIGFMSQVSPDGRTVVTSVNPATGPAPASNYFVANFRDYRFLQVFFPTRGLLSWYSRETGVLQPLPGADLPAYVQFGGVWSPDGKYLVFARAPAADPDPPGAPVPEYANDPRELQIRYDLYRIPFNGGKGGKAEPIAGASANGMSNTFPKISPDGRWIVYVQARNGQLMRPDSQLYIVPAAGGTARRMRANTPLMNSWHSFSPNGRWLVFSSKARSPYTQMYLTHIDEDGNDSPAIRIDNATAANRAVNLPEFVNLPAGGGLKQIAGPVLDYYRLVDSATYHQKRGHYDVAASRWREVLSLRPDDEAAHRNLAGALLMLGRRAEAAEHRRKAAELKPGAATAAVPGITGEGNERLPARVAAARALAAQGRTEAAIKEWRRALDLDPNSTGAHAGMALSLEAAGQSSEALAHWRAVLELPGGKGDVQALRHAAWLLATSPDASLRNGDEALALATRAIELSGGRTAEVEDTLAAAYAEKRRFGDAGTAARRALALANEANLPALAAAIRARLALYQAGKPYRDSR